MCFGVITTKEENSLGEATQSIRRHQGNTGDVSGKKKKGHKAVPK